MSKPLIRIMKQSAHGKNFIWLQAESLVCCMRRKEIRFSNQRGALRFKVDGFIWIQKCSKGMKVFRVPTTMGQVAQLEWNQLPGKRSK